MISNKLLKTQGPSLDLDSIAGPARCTPLKDKPTECGTRCSKILTSRVKLIWTKVLTRDVDSFFWVPSTREKVSIIRVLGEYSLPFVVQCAFVSQLSTQVSAHTDWILGKIKQSETTDQDYQERRCIA